MLQMLGVFTGACKKEKKSIATLLASTIKERKPISTNAACLLDEKAKTHMQPCKPESLVCFGEGATCVSMLPLVLPAAALLDPH